MYGLCQPEANVNLKSYAWTEDPQVDIPMALRTHILRLLGPKTILYGFVGLF